MEHGLWEEMAVVSSGLLTLLEAREQDANLFFGFPEWCV
jgi:hypothetical protein